MSARTATALITALTTIDTSRGRSRIQRSSPGIARVAQARLLADLWDQDGVDGEPASDDAVRGFTPPVAFAATK